MYTGIEKPQEREREREEERDREKGKRKERKEGMEEDYDMCSVPCDIQYTCNITVSCDLYLITPCDYHMTY